MIQTSSVAAVSESYDDTSAGGKEGLCFLQLVCGREPDGMHSMSSGALSLKDFEGDI